MKLHQQGLDKIKGLNHILIDKLNNEGILNILDLLELFPKKYDFFNVIDYTKAENNTNITFKAEIISWPLVKFLKRGLTRLDFKIKVDNKEIQVYAFNREFLRSIIKPGKIAFISGKLDKEKDEILASKVQLEDSLSFREIRPVYGLANIKEYLISRATANAYVDYFKYIEDDLPSCLVEKYKMLTYRQAIKVAHSPKSKKELALMERRFKYEELFKFQLKLQYLRLRNSMKEGHKKEINKDDISNFTKLLDFELTNDQNTVIDEVINGLSSTQKMSRLIQGDVGSGKTIVAAITMYLVAKSKYQSALMAPTEILAEQHYNNLKPIYDKLNINCALLTGKTKISDRKVILENLITGKIDILIGTHALISDSVNYNKLGYVVTDEQHRFGVDQRKMLRDKGENPDVLFMTATPIPRTLAITIFGDMDVSVIKELPKGRVPVETGYIESSSIDKIYKLLIDNTAKKRQSYIVVPLVEESNKIDLNDTITTVDKLKSKLPSNIKTASIHGKLSTDEKNRIMDEYNKGKIDILVSTTVIEVGVDVKNATLMIILDANRFGLSQLHQLRGRIGRNSLKSECYLVSDEKTPRIDIMTKTCDGFEISEEDMKLRGPGDFFGSKQSGIMDFNYADIVNDFKILEVARNDASKLVHRKSFYNDDKYMRLRKYLKRNITDKEMK